MPRKHAVWVIDDNAALAESLVALLTTEGVSACTVPAESALPLLEEGAAPRAVVLDLHMPHNGTSLLKAIGARPEWTFPVVVLSGYPDEMPRECAGRCWKVICKPADPLVLAAEVKRSLGMKGGGP